MQNYNSKHTELANNFAGVGAALLDLTGTAAALAAIPDTEPQQYVAAGTPENIAAILPATISPARRMRHGERPTEALVFDEPAATSDDAPDLQQLKALAVATSEGPWSAAEEYADNGAQSGHRIVDAHGRIIIGEDVAPSADEVAYIAAANPAVVLGLIARIESLTTVPEQAPSTEQEWAKVDPAVAFHLIERHAEDWADAGRMMEAWRSAVSAATKPTADLSKLQRYQFDGNEHDEGALEPWSDGEWVRFADVQSLLATKPAAAPVDRASVLREVEAVIEQAISDMLTKKGQVAGATFCLDAIRAMLAAAPVRLPQRFTAGLPAEGQKTLEDAARKLVTYSHIYTGDKQARRLAVELSLMAEMMSRTPAASTTGAAQTAEQVPETSLEQTMIEKRIELIPEYEGEWRAYVYRDSEKPQSFGTGPTPSAAVECALRTTPTHSSEAGE